MRFRSSFVTNSSTCNFIMIARKISKNDALTIPSSRNIVLMHKEGKDDGPIVFDNYCEMEAKEIDENKYDIYDCVFYSRYSDDDYSFKIHDLNLQDIPMDTLSQYKMISTFECC